MKKTSGYHTKKDGSKAKKGLYYNINKRGYHTKKDGSKAKKGLYYNINKRKQAGTSRSKSKSTVSKKSYQSMLRGFN
jgi:hypothetical protein